MSNVSTTKRPVWHILSTVSMALKSQFKMASNMIAQARDKIVALASKFSTSVKVIVSLVILFHLSAILTHVIAGGGPFVMKQISSWYRPYLKTMWMDNAYRFYAPDPGSTEVLWYKLQYEDGSTRWTQVPRREDFYLRMPFQRHMSIALLASMMIEKETVNPKG